MIQIPRNYALLAFVIAGALIVHFKPFTFQKRMYLVHCGLDSSLVDEFDPDEVETVFNFFFYHARTDGQVTEGLYNAVTALFNTYGYDMPSPDDITASTADFKSLPF